MTTIYGMTASYNGDRIPRAIDGAEASRRAAWAKYYEQRGRADALSAISAGLRNQVDNLLPLLLDLVDSVLTRRNQDAFANAYRVRRAIEEFERTHHGQR
jgi:hypothetical protein